MPRELDHGCAGRDRQDHVADALATVSEHLADEFLLVVVGRAEDRR